MSSSHLAANNKNTTKKRSPSPQFKSIMVNMVFARCLSIAAELGLADLLDQDKTPLSEISKLLKVNQNALTRLLRVLANQGIFHLHDDDTVSHSKSSYYLRDDTPGSQRSFVRMMGGSWMWQTFNHLEHSIKTGEAAFPQAFPESDHLYDYFQHDDPEAGRIFNQAMSSFSSNDDPLIADAYPFNAHQQILDIGGGEGSLLTHIKTQHPAVNTTLFDLPKIITQVKKSNPSPELNLISGDFFDEINAKADCILLKQVLHNWEDDAACQILTNCRKALTQDGKLLIIDMLIEPGQARQTIEKSIDIMMLLLLGSKERSQHEMENLLAKSDLKLDQVINLACPLTILEVSAL